MRAGVAAPLSVRSHLHLALSMTVGCARCIRLGDVSSKDGPLSYAFIIDSTGRTLMHPNLPLPDSVSSPPVFMDISLLEVSQASQH